MDKNIQLLMDKEAIKELQYKYAFAVDTKDFKLLRECYDDVIAIDFSGHDPTLVNDNMKADEWVAGTESIIKGLKSTQHQMTNFLITVDGDTAEAIVYLRAMHYLPNNLGDNSVECGGYYRNKYIRKPDGWKIKKVNLNYLWWSGNQYVFTLSAEAGK